MRPAFRNGLLLAAFLSGLFVAVAGVWLVYPPAGLITAGLTVAIVAARSEGGPS